MLNFSCRVINSLGEIKEINCKAINREDLEKNLKNQGVTLLSFKKRGKALGIKLKGESVLIFTQTLSMLLSSNLTLKDALNVSLSTFTKGKIRELINLVIEGLNKGEKFSSLLKENVTGFPPIYMGLIQVGEKTGNLNNVLKHLNSYLERSKKVKSKVQLALIYPMFILSVGIISSLLFALLVLPMFYEMFNTLGEDISIILKARGEIFTRVTVILASLISLITLLILRIKHLGKKNPKRSAPYEKLFFKLPKIGDLLLENHSLNLIFALNVLTESTLTIEESLSYSREVVTNSYLKLELDRIKESIVGGESLSLAFSKTIFPDKIPSYIKVGEKTGDINQIFYSLSDYYLEETNKKIDLFMAIIEPMFIVLVGASLIVALLMFIVPILTNLGGLL